MAMMIAKVAVATAMALAAGGALLAAEETATTTAKFTTTAARLKTSFSRLGTRVVVSGSTVTELSVKDCKDVGGRVETHDGCAKVGGNEVGLKCVIAGEHLCIDEASAQ